MLKNPLFRSLIFFTLLIGLFLIWHGIFRRSKLACIIYVVCFFLLYFFPRVIGYCGDYDNNFYFGGVINLFIIFVAGLFVVMYTFMLWPEILDDLSTSRIASSFAVGCTVYLIEIFFSVWTVAYNFVPGGIYTREGTSVLIGIMTMLLSIFVFSGKEQKKNNSPSLILNSKGPKGSIKHASSSLIISKT